MRIALHKGFLDSLEDLSKSDRRRTVELLRKLEESPDVGSLRSHKVGDFLSLSPTMEIRVIARQQGQNIILLHAGHHDKAYQWADRHRLLADSATGTYELITLGGIGPSSQTKAVTPGLGEELSGRLKASGIPPFILTGFQNCQDEEDLIARLETMSPEWQEAILECVTSGTGKADIPGDPSSLVRVLSDDEPLEEALSYSMAAWRVFLHPRQRAVATGIIGGLECVVGGPGTGKTVVCAHRAVFLSKHLKPEEVVVVFTYSLGLVRDLRKMLDELTSHGRGKEQRIWVEPCETVWKREPDSRCAIAIEGGAVVLRGNHIRLRIGAIIVDEFQDSPDEFVEWLNRVKEEANCGYMTLAYDTNQSIFRMGKQDSVKRLLAGAKTTHLPFCYRMTKALLDNALSMLSLYAIKRPGVIEGGRPFEAPIAVLAGPRVRYVQVASNAELQPKALEWIGALESRYPSEEALALIYLQYWNPHFAKSGKVDPVAEALRTDERIGRYYRFAATTKGREYFAGVIICPDDFMARDVGRAEVMRVNTLYVALTRARDELVFIYVEGSPVTQFLPAE